MATSVSSDAINLISTSGIAFDIEVADSIGATPKRVRRRLEQTPESKSLEDIEAKLKDAHSRRQQFHEWLANKARTKKKSDPVGTPVSHELAEKLEAKLCAAEQKRLELLTQEQMRLARLHESRVAAKTEAELRAEKEREEMVSKYELREQQAETNRMLLVEAEKQRRAAANERIAHSILQRITLEDKDRERAEALRAAIFQKIAAAEEKRACLLEAEKSRAQAIVLQARKVAKAVLRERELELVVKKEKLEARLLRAKRQRAEYLRQKGGCRGACHNHGHKMHKHGDRLCRKLTTCWRQFRRSMKTTLALAQEFAESGINQQSVTSLPFEKLASTITSPVALRSVQALLARIESRLKLSVPNSSEIAKIDSLLKRLSPQRKTTVGGSKMSKRGGSLGSSKVTSKEAARGSGASKNEEKKYLERYPARVFLCAYMIVGHPDAVFSSKGDREAALEEAASKLVPEFEALLSTVIDGPASTASSPPGSPDGERRPGYGHKPFAAQLLSFDSAWHSYLCRFVAWKVKDAQLLEEDLIRVACQLEVSMLQKCKVVPGEDASGLTHDTQAIRKQVLEDQRLLRDRISHLTGKPGVEKMDEAVAAVRSKFVEAKENGLSLPSPFAYSSPEDFKKVSTKPEPEEEKEPRPKSKVVRSLFTPPEASTAQVKEVTVDSEVELPSTRNERIVNEMLHDSNWKMLSEAEPTEGANVISKIESQVRATIQRAFWDRVEENLTQEPPNFGQLVNLVGEIRDDLELIVPESWRQEVRESLDLELLSQVLESGSKDFAYLRKLLDYTLHTISRLGAPARDTESEAAHQTLIEDLTKATTEKPTKDSFAKAVILGIRFAFERLQVLKQDIDNVHLKSLAQFVSGSAGVEYLQKAFAERYNLTPATPTIELSRVLARTTEWVLEVKSTIDAQQAEVEAAVITLRSTQAAAGTDKQPANPPPTFPMCTGGRVVVSGASSSKPKVTAAGGEDTSISPVKWGTPEAIVRVGLVFSVTSGELAMEDKVPESLVLNVARLRDCQKDFQRIVVTATGLLLLRQELMAKLHPTALENVIGGNVQGLVSLLNTPAVSMAQIGLFLAHICEEHCKQHYPEVKACAELMSRVLERSLLPSDAVFGRVTAAVRSSLKLVLLVGNGSEGVKLASSALKRIGSSPLVQDVVGLALKLDKLSCINVQVHGSWYQRLLLLPAAAAAACPESTAASGAAK